MAAFQPICINLRFMPVEYKSLSYLNERLINVLRNVHKNYSVVILQIGISAELLKKTIMRIVHKVTQFS